MIHLKSPEEIEHMKKGGAMLREVLEDAVDFLKPGVTASEVNEHIENNIQKKGGEPGFKKVKGYDWASCICINEQIVHTPPKDRTIEDGDVVTIDTGVFYEGLHTDTATTVQVGTKTKEVEKFLETGKRALNNALKQAKVGKRIGHISQAFQEAIESQGYSVVPELTGHGVGYELHEDPYVPCILAQPIEKTPKLKPGMTLALEVMYAMGDNRITLEEDNWSYKMADNSISAVFEHSIALSEKRTFILA